MNESGQFTSETARTASAKAGEKRGHRKAVTPELVLGKALRLLSRTISDKSVPMPQRISAARAVLSTLHEAGIRPTERDLRIVFRQARAAAPDADAGDVSQNGGFDEDRYEQLPHPSRERRRDDGADDTLNISGAGESLAPYDPLHDTKGQPPEAERIRTQLHGLR